MPHGNIHVICYKVVHEMHIFFLSPDHWIKFSHTIAGGKCVDCYVNCHGLLVSLFFFFFMKFFLIFEKVFTLPKSQRLLV